MGGNDSPVAYLTFSRHQQQRRGSSKRSGPLDDQPFSGLLRPENVSREELVDVLRAAVVDQKGEGWEGQLQGDPEGEESSPEPSEHLAGFPTKACGIKSCFCLPLAIGAGTRHIISLPQHHGDRAVGWESVNN